MRELTEAYLVASSVMWLTPETATTSNKREIGGSEYAKQYHTQNHKKIPLEHTIFKETHER